MWLCREMCFLSTNWVNNEIGQHSSLIWHVGKSGGVWKSKKGKKVKTVKKVLSSIFHFLYDLLRTTGWCNLLKKKLHFCLSCKCNRCNLNLNFVFFTHFGRNSYLTKVIWLNTYCHIKANFTLKKYFRLGAKANTVSNSFFCMIAIYISFGVIGFGQLTSY